MTKTFAVHHCDLCTDHKQMPDNTLPVGWIRVSIENPNLDRSWFERDICDSCLKLIEKAKKLVGALGALPS